MRNRLAEVHMRNGVTIISPENTYISADAEIGRDTILQPGTMIEGPRLLVKDVRLVQTVKSLIA